MTTTPIEPQQSAGHAETSLKRRSLFAAAWAAVAAMVLKQTTQPVEAGTDGDVVPGTTTSAATTTVVRMNSAYTTTGAALLGLRHTNLTDVTPSYRAGVFGFSGSSTSAVGVYGGVDIGTNGIGVQGFGDGTGAGVFGLAYSSQGVLGQSTIGSGVRGESDSSFGIIGVSNSGVALCGQVPPESSANTIALYGLNLSSYSGPYGGGFGVYAYSAKGSGIVGNTGSAGGIAVAGFGTAATGVPNAYAGVFYGPTVVANGDFTVFGGAKSAAVPHPDGTYRRLYCLESPESWFEDFGKGQLECGAADVTIDPDFAAVANLEDYHVFLTAYGNFELHVSAHDATSFRVQAKDPSASGRFSWRVVAKRKDIPAPRFETVTLPPTPMIPEPPAVPPQDAPAVRSRASVSRVHRG